MIPATDMSPPKPAEVGAKFPAAFDNTTPMSKKGLTTTGQIPVTVPVKRGYALNSRRMRHARAARPVAMKSTAEGSGMFSTNVSALLPEPQVHT